MIIGFYRLGISGVFYSYYFLKEILVNIMLLLLLILLIKLKVYNISYNNYFYWSKILNKNCEMDFVFLNINLVMIFFNLI